jgi:GR25 family glycosyltransferase involved in LPS biosynthesis
MEGVDVIYWINLDRATERRAHMKKVLSDARLKTIPTIRVSAFDSKKIELDDYFTMKKDILSVNYRVTKNEYACLLSHLETIRIFADSDYSTALILEDDVVFHKKTDTIQHVIDNAPKDWEIIRLSSNRFLNGPKKKYHTFTVKCHSTHCMADWGSQAYLITKNAAKKIIHELHHKKYVLKNDTFHVADYLLFNTLKTYTYKNLFTIRKNNDSSIQTRKKCRPTI